ncbi:hypothetical protein [Pseudoalteromonas umbrosa]|uniref:hypothetical protein n=1 Tax=Pseudoalteromonas umbrosa TaxID=3048489 RepID=UPI0024C33FDB|nr:hypothetical protein [Pseudoalteromonas sp. B95]MDK1290083.1 hypothetical protein [Pseudoalteromonas sp. B95]
MGLILVLIIASVAIAGSAAYFSVIGLAAMFSAAYWPVVVMGSSLELGKLVAASFVYRTWETTGFLMKTYLIGAIGVLMIVTSLGIFGFLSMGYGESTQKLQEVTFTIEANQKQVLQVNERLEQINKTIADVPPQYITKRMELRADYAEEVAQLEQQRKALQETMAALQKQKMEADAHVGPIIYIAAMFGIDVQDAVKFFIFALIIVFDPMAVILTLATNHAIEQYQKRRQQQLREKRDHDLALEHERAASRQEQVKEEGDSAEQKSQSLSEEIAPKSEPEAELQPEAALPQGSVAVPESIVQSVAKQAPTVSDMNAVLNKTPSRRETLKNRHKKSIQKTEEKGVLKVNGVDIPKRVICQLGKPDQDLLHGLSKGAQFGVLANQLGMTQVNLRKRCTYISTLLDSQGFKVDLLS